MPRKKLEILQIPSFVALRTTFDFKQFALRLAKIKKANGILKKINADGIITNEEVVNVDALAVYNIKAAKEAIGLLNEIKGKLTKYEKGI